jgi:hypothetical protein
MIATAAPTDEIPQEIRVEQISPGEVRYILPRRPLGAYRWAAAVPLLFALMGASFAVSWFGSIAQMPLQIGSILFAAFGAAFLFPFTVLPLAFGLAILWGNSSIEIRAGRLWMTEHVGPFRWRRWQRLTDVVRLDVGMGSSRAVPQSATALSPLANLAAIRVESSRGKPRVAAVGYPREWLLPLARAVARQIETQPERYDGAAMAGSRLAVADPVEVGDESKPADRSRQPARSDIVIDVKRDGLTFEIPPAGIRRGTAGLFAFACIWLIFIAVFTVLMVADGLNQGQNPAGIGSIVAAAAFIGVFWLVGIGIMLGALQMARRRAAIAVAGGQCMVIQIGLFGEKKLIWKAGELTAVRVGPSGVEVNDRPVMELQFIPRGGKKVGLLGGREVAELEWLAARLSQALGLAMASRDSEVLGDVDVQPNDSNVRCEQLGDGLTFTIPRDAFRKGPLGIWLFALIWNGFIAAVIGLGFKGMAEEVFPLVIMGVFGAVGIALIGFAIHWTIRRAEIAVAGNRLLVVQFGLFGVRRNEWIADELIAIRAAPSGISVNQRRLMQLQILPKQGKPLGLLTGRADQELAWIATLLRRALTVPAEAS